MSLFSSGVVTHLSRKANWPASKGIWSALQAHTQIGQIRTRMVRTPHVQAALDALAAAKHPSKASLARVKSFLTQVFSEASRRGFRDTDHNPVRDTKLPYGKAAEETYAYSLAETRQVLNLLPPCASTICAVGVFAGLRRGEIFGLQWRDFDEKAGVLHIHREVTFDKRGRMIVTEPKTESSKAAVPVIAPLAAALKAWKAAHSAVAESSWMFPAAFVRAEHPEGVLDVLGQTPINPGTSIAIRSSPRSKEPASRGTGSTHSAAAWRRTYTRSRFRTSISNKSCGTVPWMSRGSVTSRASARRQKQTWTRSMSHGRSFRARGLTEPRVSQETVSSGLVSD